MSKNVTYQMKVYRALNLYRKAHEMLFREKTVISRLLRHCVTSYLHFLIDDALVAWYLIA